MRFSYLKIFVLMFLFLWPATLLAQNNFLLRSLYPAVKIISTEGLAERFDDVVLIDVRSAFEFEVMHIDTAVDLPLTTGQLAASLDKLARSRADITLVLYCSDSTCSSAFEAAEIATNIGFKKVLVYDGGVKSWLDTYPEKTFLMGDRTAHPYQVLSKQKHNDHLLSWQDFSAKAKMENSLVVDIRPRFVRHSSPLLNDIHSIEMDSLLEAVSNRIWTEKRLLIYDMGGEEVRLLHYFLQASGYVNYYFLQSGMDDVPLAERTVARDDNEMKLSINQDALSEILNDSLLSVTDIAYLNFLFSAVLYENHAVVDIEMLPEIFDLADGEIFNLSTWLAGNGFCYFTSYEHFYVYRLNPNLVWKGPMEGDLWATRLRDFELGQ